MLLLVGLPFMGRCQEEEESSSDEDWQMWLNQSLGWDVTEKVTIQVNQSFRTSWGEDRLETYTVWGGVRFHSRSWLEHAYYLRYTQDRTGEENLNELRPTYDLVLKWKIWKLRWANRSRFEYRFREERDNQFRYRNRIRLVLPGELTPLDLKPYASAELFADEDTDDENYRVRGMLGIQTEPDGFIRGLTLQSGRRLTSDIYVMIQRTEEDGAASTDYIAGLRFGYFF